MEKTKVKMLTGIAGLPNPAYDLPEHSYAPEEIVMLHPKLASAWIEGGIAQAVREKPNAPLRTAELKPSENERPVVPVDLPATPAATEQSAAPAKSTDKPRKSSK